MSAPEAARRMHGSYDAGLEASGPAGVSAQDALREQLIPLLERRARLTNPVPDGLRAYLLGVKDGFKQANKESDLY